MLLAPAPTSAYLGFLRSTYHWRAPSYRTGLTPTLMTARWCRCGGLSRRRRRLRRQRLDELVRRGGDQPSMPDPYRPDLVANDQLVHVGCREAHQPRPFLDLPRDLASLIGLVSLVGLRHIWLL